MAQFSFSFCPNFRRAHRAPALLAACRQQAGYSPEPQQKGPRCGCQCGIMHVQSGKQNAAAQLTGSSIIFCLG